jgi:putative FmdB family regulatory protein
MPIYEYKCSACGHELESLQKFVDAPLVTCPACGKDALTKLVSAAGFQLKGSGWYQTDFKGSGGKPAAKAEKSKTETGSADAGKADAGKAEGGKADGGKSTAPADSAKSSETKSSAPATPAAATGSTPAAGA